MEVQDLHAENYKVLLKEIKNQNNQKDIQCLQTRSLNIVKVAIKQTID